MPVPITPIPIESTDATTASVDINGTVGDGERNNRVKDKSTENIMGLSIKTWCRSENGNILEYASRFIPTALIAEEAKKDWPIAGPMVPSALTKPAHNKITPSYSVSGLAARLLIRSDIKNANTTGASTMDCKINMNVKIFCEKNGCREVAIQEFLTTILEA